MTHQPTNLGAVWAQAAQMSADEVDGAAPGPLSYVDLVTQLACATMVQYQHQGDQTNPGHRELEDHEVRFAFDLARQDLGVYGVGAFCPVEVLEFIKFHVQQPEVGVTDLENSIASWVMARHVAGRTGEQLDEDLDRLSMWWRLNGSTELREMQGHLFDQVATWIAQEEMLAALADLHAQGGEQWV
jgi:hypothetical protein